MNYTHVDRIPNVTGCVGGVLALANILGNQCCDVGKLYKAGKLEEAKLLQHRLIGPNLAVSTVHMRIYCIMPDCPVIPSLK